MDLPLPLVRKMKWVYDYVIQMKAQGKGVVIYVRENSYAIQELKNIVGNFNSESYPTDALITAYATFRISGPNFYGACHRGVMLEDPDDPDDADRAKDRLMSLVQTQQTEWLRIH
ncbi:Transcription regulatory protein SNF2 [Fusarium austroafricanum]|uniref:Transcription regulatory protein SNF2 n=1 Tax=Fusarium austroafricanum TaxID=2364996 RepID=A0A8H4K4K4_9HYPO|nr:Transcription regulatory protein SNF2 [Fusarium austroafricanum]